MKDSRSDLATSTQQEGVKCYKSFFGALRKSSIGLQRVLGLQLLRDVSPPEAVRQFVLGCQRLAMTRWFGLVQKTSTAQSVQCPGTEGQGPSSADRLQHRRRLWSSDLAAQMFEYVCRICQVLLRE
jgi:hypothetical protein